MSIKKKRGITRFIIMTILAVILILGSVLNFALPNSDTDYVGFINALNTPIEYRGGTVITYEAVNTGLKASDTKNGVVAYEYQIADALSNYSYNVEVKSYYGGDDKYYLNVNLLDSFDGDLFYDYDDENADSTNTITNLINQSIEVEFKKEQSQSAEAYLTGKHIASAEGLYYSGTYGVNLVFTKEGQTAFKNLTSEVASGSSSSGTGYIYIYVGGQLFTSISCSSSMDQPSVFISGNMTNLAQAYNYASKINSARYDFEFVKVNEKIITKHEARVNSIMMICVFVLIFLALCLVVCGMFKALGLVASLSMLLATLTYVVLLQAIPGIILTTSSIICLAIPMMLGFMLTIYMFNNMKKEYAMGKKIPASVNFGFKKSYAKMIDACVLGLIPSIVLMIVGSLSLNSIGYVLTLGIVLYGFFSIVINKWFTNWYVNINGIHHKSYGFSREAHINELS